VAIRFINSDPKNISIKDGIMTVKTDIGYDLQVPIHPIVGIHEQFVNNLPAFSLNTNLGKLEVIQHPQEPSFIKDQTMLEGFLKTSSYVPETWEYQDFLIGFIYGDPNKGDPNNFKWMFQFRIDDQIFTSMIFANGIDINCPVSTFSWFDGGIYHGRMVVDKNDLLTVERSGAGRCKVVGKTLGGHPQGDKSRIPDGCDIISIRYNIYKNRWYLHYMKNGAEIGNYSEVREILADVPMTANTDRSIVKPKVTEEIKVDDIASLMVKAGVATILGK